VIESRALCKIFDGMTIDVENTSITVQNSLGNQDSLDKFIALSNKKNAQKYPLVFVGLGDVYKEFTGYKYVKTKLYILMITQEELLYKDRSDKVYAPYIEPIYQEVKKRLEVSDYVFPIGEKGEKYPYTDRPNYGIVRGDVGGEKQSESVVTDYVDARIIDLEYKIKTNCIS